MTTPIARLSHAIRPTQNTAAVHEFRALYTHDLRRKQKRWQDGILRYHTFNKRIMVYDTARNLIGDTHWKESSTLQDGDELELEVGVLVQVGECMGREETDLRSLFERSKRDGQEQVQTESHSGADKALLGRNAALLPPPPLPAQREHLKHKSLNALLGTPKGALGKAALPTKSPYELRNGAEHGDQRPAKRLRVGGERAWNITRTTTPSRALKTKETSLRAGPVVSKGRSTGRVSSKLRTPLVPGHRPLGITEVIDITSENDDENLASEITLPETPQAMRSATPILKPKRTPAVPLLWRKVDSPPAEVIEPVSPPINAKNRFNNVEANVLPPRREIGDEEVQDIGKILSPARHPRLKVIQLVKAKPRNKLICAQPSSEVVGKTSKSDAVSKGKRSNLAANPKSKREAVAPLVEIQPSPPSSPVSSAMFGLEDELRLSPMKANKRTIQNDAGKERVSLSRRTSVEARDRRNFRRVPSENDATTFLPQQSLDSVFEVDQDLPQPVVTRPSAGKLKQPHLGKKSAQRSLSENEGIGARAPSHAKGDAGRGHKLQEKPKDQEKGAWTVEALDFFDWRPPDWQERQKSKGFPV